MFKLHFQLVICMVLLLGSIRYCGLGGSALQVEHLECICFSACFGHVQDICGEPSLKQNCLLCQWLSSSRYGVGWRAKLWILTSLRCHTNKLVSWWPEVGQEDTIQVSTSTRTGESNWGQIGDLCTAKKQSELPSWIEVDLGYQNKQIHIPSVVQATEEPHPIYLPLPRTFTAPDACTCSLHQLRRISGRLPPRRGQAGGGQVPKLGHNGTYGLFRWPRSRLNV